MNYLPYFLIFILLIPLCWFIPPAYLEVKSFEWNYANELKERTRPVEVEEVETITVEIDKAMLNWVIMCESSGRHAGIWGVENEYGILQWKKETWDWLSGVLNYTGDWKNQEDQIEFFLIAVEAGYGRYWSCWKKYHNL